MYRNKEIILFYYGNYIKIKNYKEQKMIHSSVSASSAQSMKSKLEI